MSCNFILQVKYFSSISVKVYLRLTKNLRVTHTTRNPSQKRIFSWAVSRWRLCQSFGPILVVFCNFFVAFDFSGLHLLLYGFLNHVSSVYYWKVSLVVLGFCALFEFVFTLQSLIQFSFMVESFSKLLANCNGMRLLKFFFLLHYLKPSLFYLLLAVSCNTIYQGEVLVTCLRRPFISCYHTSTSYSCSDGAFFSELGELWNTWGSSLVGVGVTHFHNAVSDYCYLCLPSFLF